MSFHDHRPPALAEEAAHLRALMAIPGARRLLSDRVDFYIQMLDLMGPDPDLELDVDTDEGDDLDIELGGELDTSDEEMSLGWSNQDGQERLHISRDDREDCPDSHEGDELDERGELDRSDDEPSLGAPEQNNATPPGTRWGRGSLCDREEEADDEGDKEEDCDAPETHGRGWNEPEVSAWVGRMQA